MLVISLIQFLLMQNSLECYSVMVSYQSRLCPYYFKRKDVLHFVFYFHVITLAEWNLISVSTVQYKRKVWLFKSSRVICVCGFSLCCDSQRMTDLIKWRTSTTKTVEAMFPEINNIAWFTKEISHLPQGLPKGEGCFDQWHKNWVAFGKTMRSRLSIKSNFGLV